MSSSRESFAKVVLEGALESRGMVSFADSLSPEQVESIRAYVIASARLLQSQEAASTHAEAAKR